jgi:hypothetical protein
MIPIFVLAAYNDTINEDRAQGDVVMLKIRAGRKRWESEELPSSGI